MYFDSPQIGECLTLPGLGAIMLNQAAKAKRLVSNQSRQSQITPVATRSNQTIIHLLQTCVFGQGDVLEQKRIQKVLEAEVRLLIKDPCGMLHVVSYHNHHDCFFSQAPKILHGKGNFLVIWLPGLAVNRVQVK